MRVVAVWLLLWLFFDGRKGWGLEEGGRGLYTLLSGAYACSFGRAGKGGVERIVVRWLLLLSMMLMTNAEVAPLIASLGIRHVDPSTNPGNPQVSSSTRWTLYRSPDTPCHGCYCTRFVTVCVGPIAIAK